MEYAEAHGAVQPSESRLRQFGRKALFGVGAAMAVVGCITFGMEIVPQFLMDTVGGPEALELSNEGFAGLVAGMGGVALMGYASESNNKN